MSIVINLSISIYLSLSTNHHKILEHDVKAVGLADHCLVYCVSSFKSQSPTQCHIIIELCNLKFLILMIFFLIWNNAHGSQLTMLIKPTRLGKKLFTQVCDKHCAFVTRGVRKHFPPWLTYDIKEDIKIKQYFLTKHTLKGYISIGRC